VLVAARRLKDLKVTTKNDLPLGETVDTAPRVLKDAGLMGLPEGTLTPETDEDEISTPP
jgi:hypothetical protein